jgi:hypothetical protein
MEVDRAGLTTVVNLSWLSTIPISVPFLNLSIDQENTVQAQISKKWTNSSSPKCGEKEKWLKKLKNIFGLSIDFWLKSFIGTRREL